MKRNGQQIRWRRTLELCNLETELVKWYEATLSGSGWMNGLRSSGELSCALMLGQ